MSVANVDLGTFLKIYSTNGIYNNLSTASEMWKLVLKKKGSIAGGRELRYLLRKSYGSAGYQALPVDDGDYPEGDRSNQQEGVAQYKDFALTINVPRTVLNKTGAELLQYADPLTEEIEAKAIGAARIKSGEAFRDGAGSLGKASSYAIESGKLAVTLSTASADAERSHVGWFDEEDKIKFAEADATANNTINNTADAVAYWRVTEKDEDNDKVILTPYNSSNSAITVTSFAGATDPQADAHMYRIGTTPADLTSYSGDYNALTEEMPGWGANITDGITLNGIAQDGIFKSSTRDVGGNDLDSSDFQKVLSKVKRRCGKGRYQYKTAFMYDTVYDALVESRETDRRFQSVDDGKRGVKMLGYQHANDFVEFVTDEFVPKQRIYLFPESKDVLTYHGTDFETVEPNPGQKFHLRPSSTGGGHKRQIQQYMEGHGIMVCKHNAAIAAIKNFTVAE